MRLVAFVLPVLLFGLPAAHADRGPILHEVHAPGQHPAWNGQTDAPLPRHPARYRAQTIATGLARPWSIAFLPQNHMLVTERGGAMRIVSSTGAVSAPLGGLPAIRKGELGGLFGVVLDPHFTRARRIYFTFLGQRGALSGMAIAGARLDAAHLSLHDVRVIFRARPDMDSDTNLGGRLLFGTDGLLYATIGDRFLGADAQRLDSDLGKVIRITADGAIPPGNPFARTPGALPEIYAWGQRHAGRLAPDGKGPTWTLENGPKGGDVVNLLRKGANYEVGS